MGAYQLRSLGDQVDGVFVGRQRELGELTMMLEDALSGRGRLAMLVGEPGIGKTRTAQQLAAFATLKGAQVLWGRCHSAQGAPPYWPWVQAIRSYVRERDSVQLGAEMGPGAADISEIVPEVREKLPDLEASPTLDSAEQARFRLFDSITTFLKNAGRNQPLVLILDNLHWADRPSLLLLEFLAQELTEIPLLVVGTYRDAELSRRHPLTQTLGELAREPWFRQMPLRGLRDEEVGRYIEFTSGFTPPQDLVEAVHTQTEGNPLFMVQVVQLLTQEGEIAPGLVAGSQGWRIQIPVGVHEAIGRRLSLLSERSIQVLTVASVVGREFQLRLLELLEEESGDQLLEVLEEALAARVIEEVPPAVGRYRFTHVLIQNTLARDLSTLRQARLHQHIGKALEELYGEDVEDHAVELAYHFAEAAPATGKEKLVRYSLLAGEQALAAYAHEEALAHFERGLAAKNGQPIDGETADLLFGMGRALVVTLERHRVQEALDQLNQAFDYYAATGDIFRAVAVAECPIPTLAGQRTGMAQLLTKALALVAPDSHEAGRLLSLYGRVMAHQEGDYQASQEALDQALTIAQREGDAYLEIRILADAAYSDFTRLRHSDCIEKGRRLLELSHQVGNPSAMLLGLYGSVYALCTVGNLSEARQHAAACVAAGEKFRDRWWYPGALGRYVTVSMLEGNWQTAREFSDRALTASKLDPRNLGKRVVLEHEVGNWSQGQEFLKRLLEARQLLSPMVQAGAGQGYPAAVIPVAARASGDLSLLPEAQQAARTILSSDIATPFWSQVARIGLAMVAVLTEHDWEAREQYNALSALRGTLIHHTNMSGDRLLGLLAQTMGDLERAASHFEDAVAFCRKAGYRPQLAWSLCDNADCLLKRNGPEDREQARTLLEDSLVLSRELGMRPLIERALERLDRMESQPGPAPAYPDGLTPREGEVLRLIALGRSNQELAAELVLSLRTVERHITNIYGKISARGRADATAYALGHGLVDQM
ncbi:MAG: AAA family ATPase [Stenotrophomonas maltophilia]